MFPVEVMLVGAVRFRNSAEPTGAEALTGRLWMKLVVEDRL